MDFADNVNKTHLTSQRRVGRVRVQGYLEGLNGCLDTFRGFRVRRCETVGSSLVDVDT